MDINNFRIRATEQDARNMFESSTDDVSDIPKELQEFYRRCNPIDVEIDMDGNPVKFYPLSDLDQLQKDYNLQDGRFVFATRNADSIYLYRNKVFTRCHGNSAAKDEEMANSFLAFLSQID